MGLFKNNTSKTADQATQQARQAWDSGHRYYAPAMAVAAGTQSSEGVSDTPWGEQLGAIEAVGWKLHTWQTTSFGGSSSLATKVVAHPLFVRP